VRGTPSPPSRAEVANTTGTGEEGDAFGAALACGDFDVSGRSDLAIGVPDEAIGTITDAGVVHVLYAVP